MGNYSDLSSTFKLIHGQDTIDYTRRNMAIFAMLLNGLGIPDKFHEFVTAIFLSGNWDQHSDMEEIPYKRLARNLSSLSNTVYETVYNRIKKNAPAFLKWQEENKLDLITHESFRDPEKRWPRTKYGFPHYSKVAQLFSLDKSISQKEIRKMVDDTCKAMPRVTRAKRAPRRRTKESLRESAAKAIQAIKDASSSTVEFQSELELLLEEIGITLRFTIN